MAKVTVRQTQETNDGILLFELPTQLRFHVGDQVIDHDIVITDREHEFYVPLPAQPTIVRFDPQYTLLAKVSFDKPDAMLFAQLQQSDDVIGRLLAVAALAKRKTHDSVEHLKRALDARTRFLASAWRPRNRCARSARMKPTPRWPTRFNRMMHECVAR